ncbi:short-chain dehydrogenase [Bacillus sp. FJAT-27264]|uniref:SDR family NAD(P)-dependent oxidoreductase n=1 Tax=Paenibacillus sp. (strain DSM 101736 / FJAT-27264) TaxID=1850362 RepID=UPI0008081233|nr:SDR family NAD(P)-dependent oxidoreductase [Bacillus sp. FJAT-27264]OBZ14350.1 short-chain dehydrogenase [Bacillus sp. FJAT-27264]
MSKKLAVIVGAGPGVSLHVAHKFGQNGFHVVLAARNKVALEEFTSQLRDEGIAADYIIVDAGSTASIEAGFQTIKEQYGSPDLLIYNAAVIAGGNPSSLTSEVLTQHLQVDVVGALESTRQVLPDLLAKKSGTILFTGGGLSLFPSAQNASLSIGKAAVRNFALTLAEELKPEGIFVGTVTIAGTVKPDTYYDPAIIADAYWKLYTEREEHEILFKQP